MEVKFTTKLIWFDEQLDNPPVSALQAKEVVPQHRHPGLITSHKESFDYLKAIFTTYLFYSKFNTIHLKAKHLVV